MAPFSCVCMWFVAIQFFRLPNTHAHTTHISRLFGHLESQHTRLRSTELYGVMECKRFHELEVFGNIINSTLLVLPIVTHYYFGNLWRKKNWRHWLVLCHFFFFLYHHYYYYWLYPTYIRNKIYYTKSGLLDAFREAEVVALTVKWRAFSDFVTIALKPYAAHYINIYTCKATIVFDRCSTFYSWLHVFSEYTHFLVELMNEAFKVEQTINLICHQDRESTVNVHRHLALKHSSFFLCVFCWLFVLVLVPHVVYVKTLSVQSNLFA